MAETPIIKSVFYPSPKSLVWKCLVNKEMMRPWYFEVEEEVFSPTVGFKFSFWGESDEKKYLHLCEIKEIVEEEKISYTWTYKGYAGESLVQFELQDAPGGCLLTLTHFGIASFPEDNKDFRRTNFDGGWTAILEDSLANFLRQQ